MVIAWCLAIADLCAPPSSTVAITVMGNHSDSVYWCLLTVTAVQVIGLIMEGSGPELLFAMIRN